MPSTRFWHPFADMAKVDGNEIVIERGEGVWVWDTEGRRYLDANAGLWYCNVGHGRSELARAAAAQAEKLAAYSAFGPFATPPALDLAERVAELAPMADGVVFFTSGGSEAVETAAKIARRYWNAVGQSGRQAIVIRENAYHGMGGFGTSLAGILPNINGFGDLVPHVVTVPHDDAAALDRLLIEQGDQVAAFIGEPVIGAGGVIPPSEGYWPEVQRTCRKHDVLVITDEVVTGFGRLGNWFGSERYGLEPDIVTTAKGITSGYLPLGGCIVGPRVHEPFWSGRAGVLRHGFTYSGHATACAVALANLDVLEQEKLVERVADLEPALAEALAPLAASPLVGEVRVAGLLGGVQLDADVTAVSPDLAERVVALLRERGVLLRAIAGPTLQISPAFIIQQSEIRLLAETILDALNAAEAELELTIHA